MERPVNPMDLTKRELDIMRVLWESPKAMIASEIADAAPNNMTMNTAQALLRRLLKNGFIVIDKVVYSNTVLCRSYKPRYTEEEYTVTKLTIDYHNFDAEISICDIVCELLKLDTTREELEQDIKQLKEMVAEFEKKWEEKKKKQAEEQEKKAH